ncbi:nitrilase-related carbon-nitrogen hydrolase [Streptomyces galbus]|uniref:nitrilase-related carbon-nitrogen hydrolase n=1 Tax=Streptomyces galbus TaxID=33898 RepID=UPI0038056DEB
MNTAPALGQRPTESRTVRSVAQSTVPQDPTDRGALRAAGQEIRALMAEAARAGARLVQFPIVYPSKHVMAAGPDGGLDPADWSRAAWDVLREEAESIAALAGELPMWTAFGSLHPLTPPNKPHDSLFIVSDRDQLVARYDKRLLSHTEISYLYTPGREPLVIEVDGMRIGRGQCCGRLEQCPGGLGDREGRGHHQRVKVGVTPVGCCVLVHQCVL